jgi:mannosyltransferase
MILTSSTYCRDTIRGSALRHRTPMIMGGIVAVGAFLRFLYLGSKSPWLDEISTVMFVRLSRPEFWQVVREREANMLLYYLLLRAWIHLGNSEFVLRLPSVIFGVASLFAIYALAKESFDRRTSLLCAGLLAVNAAHVRASQWMRSYSALVLLVVLSTLLFARAIERPTRRTWTLYVLLAGVAVYIHFMAGLLIAAQWLALLFVPRSRLPVRWMGAAALALAAVASPAALYVATHNVGQLNWVANPRPLELYHLAVFLAAGGGKAVGAILAVIFAILIAACFRDWQRRSSDARLRCRYSLLFATLLFPPLASFALSFWKPIFFYRYLIVSLPALLVLAGRGLALLPGRWLAALTPAILGLSLAAVAISYRPEEDWKGACTYLLTNARDGDVVLFSGRGRDPLDYYGWRLYGGHGGPQLKSTGYPSAGHAGKIYAYFFHRVWYLQFPSFVTDETVRQVESNLAEAYPVRRESKFKAITVTLYETGDAATSSSH